MGKRKICFSGTLVKRGKNTKLKTNKSLWTILQGLAHMGQLNNTGKTKSSRCLNVSKEQEMVLSLSATSYPELNNTESLCTASANSIGCPELWTKISK